MYFGMYIITPLGIPGSNDYFRPKVNSCSETTHAKWECGIGNGLEQYYSIRFWNGTRDGGSPLRGKLFFGRHDGPATGAVEQ